MSLWVKSLVRLSPTELLTGYEFDELLVYGNSVLIPHDGDSESYISALKLIMGVTGVLMRVKERGPLQEITLKLDENYVFFLLAARGDVLGRRLSLRHFERWAAARGLTKSW